MHRSLGLYAATLVSILLLSGCISAKSFVDPTYAKVSYDDVRKLPAPLPLKLNVEFRRNGEPFPKADSTLRDSAERVLRASGVIVPAAGDSEGEIKVVVDNIADLASARAKGFGTGLTFGLAGTTVTDAYEMSVTITVRGRTMTRTAVRHALHTAVGNTSLPEGVEGVPPNVAFQRVMEQMLLRVLQDMQKSGELAALNAPKRAAGSVRSLSLVG